MQHKENDKRVMVEIDKKQQNGNVSQMSDKQIMIEIKKNWND